VNGNAIYLLEFTSRFGYPTIFIQQEALLTPTGNSCTTSRTAPSTSLV